MAVVGTNVVTFADVAKRMDPGGKIDKIVEMMEQFSEVLEDMHVVEANDGTGHKGTVRTGLPQAAWRMLNYGVPRVKSHTAQVRDTTGMLEAYNEVDKALADLNGNTQAFRLSEANATVEGMTIQMAETIFYGNTDANPERFLGLAPRYSTINGAQSGANIVDAGGTGSDNTSVWLVVWGENTVHGIYPRGSMAGLQQKDLGEQTLHDANGNMYQGYRAHFKWDLGLVVKDWRYVVRIANVDVSDVRSNPTSMANLLTRMIEAEEMLPSLGMGRAVWYGNRGVRTAMRKAALDKVSNNLTYDEIAGKRVTSFDGIPFRRVDGLLNTEARVV